MFHAAEFGLDFTGEGLERVAGGVVVQGAGEVDVDGGKWFGDLQSIPGSREDPSAAGNDDDGEDGTAGFFGKHRDAALDASAGAVGSVDGQKTGAAGEHVTGHRNHRSGATLAGHTGAAAIAAAADRTDAESDQCRNDHCPIAAARDHRGGVDVAAHRGADLMGVEGGEDVPGTVVTAGGVPEVTVGSDAASERDPTKRDADQPSGPMPGGSPGPRPSVLFGVLSEASKAGQHANFCRGFGND